MEGLFYTLCKLPCSDSIKRLTYGHYELQRVIGPSGGRRQKRIENHQSFDSTN